MEVSMPSSHHRLSIVLLLSLAACRDGDPSIEAEHAAVWANAGSALGVYTNLHVPVAFTLGEHEFADPTCPVTGDNGVTATITGGCTDSEGKRFEGSMRITRVDGPRDLDLSYTDYGSGEGDIVRTSGTASVRQTGTDLYAYEANLVVDGGATVDITYSGTVSGDYGQATLWNGTGTITRTGFPPEGTAAVETVDQLVDDSVCSGQSVSGETTIEVDGHTIVITYDGESDCDEANAARWSLDGKDQGLVEGITCAVTPGGGRAGAGLFVLALLACARARRSRIMQG
jgi:hypothetical protein